MRDADSHHVSRVTERESDTDLAWMQEALRLARRGWGRTSPNPMVGAILARDGATVGAGAHLKAGSPHAEIHALREAGEKARGATMYVTLEPCSTRGRTGPCTEAILKAGVRRVVIGCVDPNPLHAGRAVELLREAGVHVTVGVAETACRRLNEAFFCWVTRRRPFVTLKMAMTLDGKIATAAGESKWITGPASREYVQRLRRFADAILVGAETVRQDDPSLKVREPADWEPQPARLIWSRSGNTGSSRGIFSDADRPPVFVAADDRQDWIRFLEKLARQNILSVLVEGGGELASSLLRAGLVDKVAFFIAPRLLGGRNSRPVIAGPDPVSLTDALSVEEMQVERCGDDLLITGYPRCSQD